MASTHDQTIESTHTVSFQGDGVLLLADRVIGRVHAELFGGRNRYSVAGHIAEGPRWWRGCLEWNGDVEHPPPGTKVFIDLRDGRVGVAVIEPHPDAPGNTSIVHGVGPPPFDVP